MGDASWNCSLALLISMGSIRRFPDLFCYVRRLKVRSTLGRVFPPTIPLGLYRESIHIASEKQIVVGIKLVVQA